MKMEPHRQSVHLVPENEIDVAYIEEVLGLRHTMDTALAIRRPVQGTDALAYVEIVTAKTYKEAV